MQPSLGYASTSRSESVGAAIGFRAVGRLNVLGALFRARARTHPLLRQNLIRAKKIGTSIFRKPLFRTPNWKSVYGLDKNRLRGVFKKMNQGPEQCGEKNDFVVEE